MRAVFKGINFIFGQVSVLALGWWKN